MSDNGKDVEIVEGNVTPKATVLGLRIKSAKTNEDDEDGTTTEATIVGVARGLVRLVGESVQIATVGGGRRLAGHVRSVKVEEGKKGGPRTVTVRLGAPREINKLVGNQVLLEAAQGVLPGLEAEVEAEEGPVRLGEIEAVQPPPKKTRRPRGSEAAAPRD